MIDEYNFAHRRKLLWSQRWHGMSGLLRNTLQLVLYTLQIAVAIFALYAITHH